MADVRSFHPDPTWTAARANAIKNKRRTSIAVCLPCRDEATTIGPLVEAIRRQLVDDVPLIDELIVLDDGSGDDTAAVAAAAGAKVVAVADVTAALDSMRGKGNVLWASLLASEADLIVWCDADLTSFEPSWIVRLVMPLLLEPAVGLVKADYVRPDDRGGGGRTTELAARPMLSLFFPEFATLAQPLGGEVAGRRSILETVPFVTGWGVEVGLLIDVRRAHGLDAIAQVDLGVRHHRHRPLAELAVQAAEVSATVLLRAGVEVPTPSGGRVLRRPNGDVVVLNLGERPAIASLR